MPMRFLIKDACRPELHGSLVSRLRVEGIDVTMSESKGRSDVIVLIFDETTQDIERAFAHLSASEGVSVLIAGVVPRTKGECLGRALARAGAGDVLLCPDREGLLADVVARVKRLKEIGELMDSPWVRERAVGEAPAWRLSVKGAVEAGRLTTACCALMGESGTGKDLLARLIHDLDPRRKQGPFIVVDCTTLRPELSGSELFGHTRGAFTNAVSAREGAVALAHGGTLFLDEIGELENGLQAQLLRVIQEHMFKPVGGDAWRPSDFRLLCATNRDLREEVKEGRFRRDLFFRVTQWEIHLPALRDRRSDIPLLTRHFVRHGAPEGPPPQITPELQEILAAYDYPGNVRELKNIVTRVCDRSRGMKYLTVGALPSEFRGSVRNNKPDWRATLQAGVDGAVLAGRNWNEIPDLVRQFAMEAAYSQADGRWGRAAEILGVDPRTLQLRRKRDRRRATTGSS